MLQWPPPDVASWGPLVNKFEKVSSVGHQISVVDGEGAGAGGGGPRSDLEKVGD